VVDDENQKQKLINAIGKEIEEAKKRVTGFAGQLAPYLADVPAFIAVVGTPRVKQEFPPNRTGVSGEKIYYASFGAVMQNLLLAAASLGLGTVFFTVGSEPWAQEELRKVLDIPAEDEVLFCVPVGYPLQELDFPDEGKRKPLDEILYWNKYQK